ncbi:hypothetical protein TNCV_1870571 [Trichonephila clavipes]|nr:hypothetical protein TNCV_1870571 [Trichonephila clavipes]
MEAGWSAKRVARQLGHSYCVERRCWDQWIREMSFPEDQAQDTLDRLVVEKSATLCDEVIDQTLGNTVPLRKKCNLQVSDSSRRPWSRRNVSSDYVPNMLDWIQVRRARWPFHTLYCFSFKHVLHQTSSMRSGIIILENKGISNGSSVRDDMRSKYLVCIPSARQSAIPNDMQVRTSAYADSTPYHSTSSSVL